MGPMAPLEVQQQALGGSFVYGAAAPTDAVSGGVHSSYNPYIQGSATGFPSMQVQSSSLSNDSSFPERPGMPECQYYIKTGDCKFGMSCRYHHPRERISSMQTAILSPIGLPLRPGVPVCTFYTRYGICKFGPTCKFDHPMSHLAYSPSASSLVDMPIVPYPAGSSVAAILPSSSETAIPGPTSILNESTGASEVQGEYESSYINGRTNDIASDVPAANATNQSSNPESSELRGT